MSSVKLTEIQEKDRRNNGVFKYIITQKDKIILKL